MLTKNLTPFLFAAKVTSLRPPAPMMTMIVRASFRLRPGEPLAPIEGLLEQGPLTSDVFAEGDDDRAGECLYASDFADFKLNAEVLLSGACHAPGGRPTLECPVRFSVGSWSKTLVVTGRRRYRQGIVGAGVSEPEAFVTMPLTYANAFGGPAYAANPVGKGWDTDELPNVEHPAARVRRKGEDPGPAGFGPLSPQWPQRAGKVGKEYGAKWRKERAPFYAEDFDWTYFHAAPVDQQIEGYLKGDEELSFANLHPDAPAFSTRLAGLRIRAFAKDVQGTLREAAMSLDTLVADLPKETLLLTWRGLVPVAEDDLADVKTVLIASEKLSDPMLPEAHYREILEAFEADPQEMERHAPGMRRAMAALQAADKENAAHPERTRLERAEALLRHDEALLGLAPEDQREEMRRSLAAARAEVAAKKVPPAGAEPSAGELIAASAARVSAAVESLRAQGASAGDLEELDRLLQHPDTKKRIAALTPPRPDEIGPGKDLSERNLSEMNLEGVDLSGANLEMANLTGARLAGAKLAGANLKMAMLGDADLAGADLSGADLTLASLTHAHARGADLRRTVLDQTLLDRADLREARLSEARGRMTMLNGADLTGADLHAVDLFKAVADDVVLAGADLTGAALSQCSFSGAKAEGLKLAEAALRNTSFAGADLRRADCRGVRGEATNWSEAALEEASYRLAVLPRSHFTGAKAEGARFFGADLREADFYRACLDRADFERANLFGANFGKSTLNATRFAKANLFASRFIGAGGKDTDLSGANTKRVLTMGEASKAPVRPS